MRKLDLPPYVYFTVRNLPPVGDTQPDNPTDLLAFLLVIYLVSRSNAQWLTVPSLLRIIAKHATYYFLVICTSHLALGLTLLLARVRYYHSPRSLMVC